MVHKVILCGGVMLFVLVSHTIIGETSVMINLKSGVLVLGGSLMSAFLAFPMRTIKELAKNLKALLRKKETDREDIVRQIASLARIARMDGVRALEAEGKKANNPFVRKGIDLVVDGYDRFEIHNISFRPRDYNMGDYDDVAVLDRSSLPLSGLANQRS